MKGLPFLSKMVYKKVRIWTSEQFFAFPGIKLTKFERAVDIYLRTFFIRALRLRLNKI